MRRQQVRLVVLLGAISIIGIITVQAYFLYEAWNTRERQLNQSINIALKTVAFKISRLNQTLPSLANPVRQMTSNYYVVDVNSEIDADVLEHYLKNEFERLNISIDYEYAIYDCHSDRMVNGNYISAGKTTEPSKSMLSLPKYQGYLYYFGIHFPAMRNTIATEMTIFFFFSAILIILVIFFAYAMFVILQQKRFSELQKDFINNMTHEFKTPISTINISADIITQAGIVHEPERLQTYGRIIKNENQRLNLLVEKVLQVARFEKGGIQLKKEWLDLNLLIQTVAGNFTAGLQPTAKLEIMTDPAVGKVLADVVHLTNIIHNLLDNALKYAGNQPQIIIRTQKNQNKVLITISDNGPGIHPKFRNKVFRKFFRIPSGNLHDVKGFGLGLFYVKNICRAHQWNIHLESKTTPGASFVIEIPCKS
ncbi:MAG: HAMP domain-containing histidine kinase [Lentimicrobium sp.]|nr:HAMP domain-containing histidine kinase [Lentimicrobium sp.]